MNPAPNILVTGFEPFSHYAINSSWEGAQHLASVNTQIHVLRLPVDYLRARSKLLQTLRSKPFDLVLLTGLAAGSTLRLETRARKPDAFSAENGYHTRHGHWPWAQSLTALRTAGLPAYRSTDAGAYVCESTYWAALDHRVRTKNPPNLGFLHVPPLSKEWPVENIARAMRIMIDAGVASLPSGKRPSRH